MVSVTEAETQTSTDGMEAIGVQRVHVLRQVHPASTDGAPLPIMVLGDAPVTVGRAPGVGGLIIRDEHRRVSRAHARVTRNARFDCYLLTDLGRKNGTLVNGRRITEERLTSGSRIRVGDTLLLYTAHSIPTRAMPTRLDAEVSLARAQVERLADRAARMHWPVLVVGPTGAGKERLAQRLHTRSGRRGSLVSINCAALNPELLGSELFGHVKGAFTGATSSRKGLFVEADGGTLFLDELGELPQELQASFLRVLQEGRVRPVGAERDVPVDVRVIAATNQDLDEMVEAGTFRRDLLARWGIRLDLPGLAGRRAEVLPLLRGMIGGRRLTVAAAEVLLAYDWPDNVRGLQKVAAHLDLLEVGEVVGPHDLPGWVRPVAVERVKGKRPTYEALHALLVVHQGNISRIAEALGVARQQVFRWLKALELDQNDFRPK